MFQPDRIYFYLRILLFAFYFLNGIYIINNNSISTDESDHFSYGVRLLKGNPEKIYQDDASTLPISALNAIPRAIENVLNPGLQKSDGGRSDIKNGRYISLLICFFAALIVYRWSRDLYGEKAGLFSLFLFTFCPNINGHIPLVATDAFAMLFVISSAYYFRRFVIFPTWHNFIWFSIHLGLAQISKQSLVVLFVFYGVLALIILIKRGFFKDIRINLIRLLVLFCIVCLIINLGFLFNGFGKSLDDYSFNSKFFQGLQHLKGFNQIPLPLPAPFVEGFDQVKYMLSLGSGNEIVSPRSYLFGKYFTGNGLWYYYPVVFLFKTPLTILILLPLAIFSTFRSREFRNNTFSTSYLLTLALFFLLLTSILNRSQHSLRHLLMIFPLVYICLGQVMAWISKRLRIVLPVTILYGLFTYYSFFPNLLAYTNELLWDKSKVYKVLDSSTIDYFQSSDSYLKYLKENPQVRIPTDQPEAGTFILDVGRYQDPKNTGHYQWLRNFEPYDHVNFCYLLFKVNNEDLDKLNQNR